MPRISSVVAASAVASVAATLSPTTVAAGSVTSEMVLRRADSSHRTTEETDGFAGYVAPLGSNKKIVGTVVVPTFACGDENMGIDTLFELASAGGERWVDAAVFSACDAGVVSHTAGFEALIGEESELHYIRRAVESGDQVRSTSRYVGTEIRVTMKNLTQGWTARRHFTGLDPSEGAALQWRVFLDGDPVPPLEANTTVQDVQIGGVDLGDGDRTRYVLVDEAGVPLVRPGHIRRGTDFTYKFVE